MKKTNAIFFIIIIFYIKSYSQQHDVLSYVNPFIGTTNSGVVTKWGSEGGTYPGATAPSGFIQLTPETRTNGYDYTDSSILYFSCLNHSSGFPGGSSGNLFIMPVNKFNRADPLLAGRPFQHKNEKAAPGYYSVVFSDDNTFAETSASERTGFFRITFPAGIKPEIFIGDAGTITFHSDKIIYTSKNNAVINFNENFSGKKQTKEGVILSFASSPSEPFVLLLRLSASAAGTGSAQKNIHAEKNKTFDSIQKCTANKWKEYLSVVEVNDSNETNKQKFYTALYHSLLIPWIISDAEGNYKGADGLIHKTTGHYEYGNFSPWDTYRSLNPLLSLLYPGKQSDILRSMMNVYNQSGYLPTESMTGNHVIQIIADAYFKGIKGINFREAYAAMKKQILTGPFIQKDMDVYHRLNYIPFIFPESVTRTVEYAYDDWALAQLAKSAVKNKPDYDSLKAAGFNYKNLFYAGSMFLLPRNKNEFFIHPGNIGYKEGDKWVYSYSVPYDVKGLVNLMGGDAQFASRLNEALTNQQIVFDNETVFHVPYLFNFAGREDLTQKWIRKIIDTRFTNTPSGLPGNDDLGSASSWFVLSALGIYPFCPGTPAYTICSPLFASATLYLANKKILHIKSLDATPDNYYVHSLLVNNKPYRQLSISHAMIMNGGEMLFNMANEPGMKWFGVKQQDVFSETKNASYFKMYHYSLSANKVFPNDNLWLRFSIKNKGATGTKVVKLFIDGNEYGFKNCFVKGQAAVSDSINIKLYNIGVAHLKVDGKTVAAATVIKPPYPYPGQPAVTSLTVKPIVKKGNDATVSFEAQNIGGAAQTFYIPLRLNNELIKTVTVNLLPGEAKNITEIFMPEKVGLQEIEVYKNANKFKVYSDYKDAEILNLKLIDEERVNTAVHDRSGFDNNGIIVNSFKISGQKDSLLLNKDCYAEVPNSYSLDYLDSTITVMAWVYSKDFSKGLTDMITKGDNDVLQLADGRLLTFFAGGWGRGDCTVDLPGDWQNHWHHIAGVCNGKNLKVYIDGILKGTTQLQQSVNLSNNNKWTIGRNEEFPMQRIFTGYIDQVRVFAIPLKQEEIVKEMKQGKYFFD